MFWRKQLRPEPAARVACVPVGTRVYAVGDIHGRDDLLERLLAQIADDAAGSSCGRHVLVFLGDYVDRGMDSQQVVERLLGDPIPDMESVYLRGNHEQWMLDFLDQPEVGADWLAHGGQATLLSYGVQLPPGMLKLGTLGEASHALARQLPDVHRTFLSNLALTHREGDYLFVHAGIAPGVPLEQQRERDLLWIRERFTSCEDDHGVVVVHGHSVGEKPEDRANRICVDTGAYATGRLSCVVLEGVERRFLQAH